MIRTNVMTLGHIMKSLTRDSIVCYSRNALTQLDVKCRSLSNMRSKQHVSLNCPLKAREFSKDMVLAELRLDLGSSVTCLNAGLDM